MEVTVRLDDYDYRYLHDIILNALDIEPTKITSEFIDEVWKALPERIQHTAIEWGTSDTVFREEAYTWLEKHKEKFI